MSTLEYDIQTTFTSFNLVTFNLNLGMHTIHLVASNLLGTKNTSIPVSILSKIKDHDVYLSSNWVEVGDNVTVYVRIKGGSDVNLDINFGDGTRGKYVVADAHSKNFTYYNVTHR